MSNYLVQGFDSCLPPLPLNLSSTSALAPLLSFSPFHLLFHTLTISAVNLSLLSLWRRILVLMLTTDCFRARLKQNRYPVIHLVDDGGPDADLYYHDVRCHTVASVLSTSVCNSFLVSYISHYPLPSPSLSPLPPPFFSTVIDRQVLH